MIDITSSLKPASPNVQAITLVQSSMKSAKKTSLKAGSPLDQSKSNSMPSSLADEEPVDQKKYLEDSCKPKCVKPLLEYQACVKRIQDDESGNKHCTGQYFDYWCCVDKCVAAKLFTKLK